MRVIIVDDELEIIEDLKEMISDYEIFEIVGTYTNPLLALEDAARINPECAFLDIDMPSMNGIGLAERLLEHNPSMEITFITAYNHYATQAFEVNAIDYVLKPVHPDRFRKTVERIEKSKNTPSKKTFSKVNLRTFGSFDILLDSKPLKWNRSKARELMAYLIHFEGMKKDKYVISEDIWPEYEPQKALTHLQTAMCSLRKSLGIVSREHIRINFFDDGYILQLENVEWDIREFLALYDRAKISQTVILLERAIATYQDDYLGNEGWSWSQLETINFAKKYEELLKILAYAHFECGNFYETVEVLLRLAKRQPLDLKTQLMFAESACANGGTAGMKKQINLLRNIYRQEYDMDIELRVIQYCAQRGLILE